MKKTKETKRERNEKLTNRYMIQLSWGVLGIIAFVLIYNASKNADTLVMIQPLAWILTGVFTAGAFLLWVLGKTGIINNTDRAYNYAIFTSVCALFSLWLALYNRLRMIMEDVLQAITQNPTLIVDSYWNVRIPIILIVAYLVIAFIVFAVKVTKK